MKQGLKLIVWCWICFSAVELLAVESIHLGPRPFFLVENMDEGPLKEKLSQCSEKPVGKRDFSIGHRGAALQFPEHTRESYLAAARMGAGIIECDVTFTRIAIWFVGIHKQICTRPPIFWPILIWRPSVQCLSNLEIKPVVRKPR